MAPRASTGQNLEPQAPGPVSPHVCTLLLNALLQCGLDGCNWTPCTLCTPLSVLPMHALMLGVHMLLQSMEAEIVARPVSPTN